MTMKNTDMGNYRVEIVLTFYIWAFGLQAKMRSHRKYRAELKKLIGLFLHCTTDQPL
jgi:hypothetical protein